MDVDSWHHQVYWCGYLHSWFYAQSGVLPQETICDFTAETSILLFPLSLSWVHCCLPLLQTVLRYPGPLSQEVRSFSMWSNWSNNVVLIPAVQHVYRFLPSDKLPIAKDPLLLYSNMLRVIVAPSAIDFDHSLQWLEDELRHYFVWQSTDRVHCVE